MTERNKSPYAPHQTISRYTPHQGLRECARRARREDKLANYTVTGFLATLLPGQRQQAISYNGEDT